MRLIGLLAFLPLLIAAVPFDRPTKSGARGNKQDARPSPIEARSPEEPEPAASNVSMPHYPWAIEHDKNRPNHQDWGQDPGFAYCLHVKPGSHKPKSPVITGIEGQTTYLAENCTRLLHVGLDDKNPSTGFNKLPCGELPPAARVKNVPGTEQAWKEDGSLQEQTENGSVATFTPAVQLTAYLALNLWDEPEHCRAGCETCFDAMAEYGAEQAVCRRARKTGAQCGMGVVRGPAPLECGLDDPKKCKLLWDQPRWIELGYPTYDDAYYAGLHSFQWDSEEAEEGDGDIRVYYVKELHKVGAEVHGGWGKRQVLASLLQGKTTAKLEESWLIDQRNGNWHQRSNEVQQPETVQEHTGEANKPPTKYKEQLRKEQEKGADIPKELVQ